MKPFNTEKTFNQRPPSKRVFVINPDIKTQKNLKYFMQQELAYYNVLVENFNARIKAFPQDVVSIKDRDIKLLETCGELAVNPVTLLSKKNEEWPDALKSYNQVIFDANGESRLNSRQLAIMQIGAVPAQIHHQVRRNMLSELFSLISSQANIFLSAQKTEQLKAPVYMLQQQVWDTKHHLQIPKSLVKMTYNESMTSTDVTTPYNKIPITVSGFDLTKIPYTMIVLRAPNTGEEKPTWRMEFKDVSNKYLLNLSDPKIHKRKQWK